MAGLYEAELEGFADNEEFLGGLLQGVGSALGLGEGEEESEDQELEMFSDLESSLGASLGEGEDQEWELESEFEDSVEGEEFVGDLLKGGGSALGLGEYEDEYELEGEYEWEDQREEFLPALLPIAKLALPHLAKAALPMIGRIFGRKRREFEGEPEGVDTAAGLAAKPSAMAELVATMAAKAPTTAEAEAMIGAATVLSLTPRERRQLEHLVPQLVRTSALLTKLLRRNARTRVAVRVIPTVVKATAVPLVRPGVVAVRPVPPPAAGRVMQTQVARVLGRPALTRAVMRRNAAATRRAASAVRRRQPIR